MVSDSVFLLQQKPLLPGTLSPAALHVIVSNALHLAHTEVVAVQQPLEVIRNCYKSKIEINK